MEEGKNWLQGGGRFSLRFWEGSPTLVRAMDDLNLTSPNDVRSLLASWGFHPSRVLGQNFLIDRNILNILLDAAEGGAGETVVEPGPGLGVLTEELLRRGATVLAVEKDPKLAEWLRTRHGNNAAFQLMEGDALDAPLAEWFGEKGATKLVSNLPYAIAARLLMEAAGLEARPTRMAVTVQKEVADRMAAKPGSGDYGILAICLQRHYDVRTAKVISRTCFWPAPEVTSAISLLVRRPEPLGGAVDEGVFRNVVRHVFSQRRKTLGRSLRNLTPDVDGVLAQAELAPSMRPEEVPVERWAALARGVAQTAQ